MKRLLCVVALGVLSAQAFIVQAQTNPSLMRVFPRSAMTNRFRGTANGQLPPNVQQFLNQRPGIFGTNTPAFDEWAAKEILHRINETRLKWNLPVPKAFTTNDIAWYVYPTRQGIQARASTKDDRYDWMFTLGMLQRFYDDQYSSKSFELHDDVKARLVSVQSKITMEEAQKIAEDGLQSLLGATRKELHLLKPKTEQWKYTDDDEKKHDIPLYSVKWIHGDYPDMQVEIQVSGITKTIVGYWNYNPNTPHFPLPTNFVQMVNPAHGYGSVESSSEQNSPEKPAK
jgi:hypothetical protein